MFSGEETLFEEYLNRSEYSIAGFSYGAVKAFKRVEELLLEGKRVDTLQLFSPAFFQNIGRAFIKTQLIHFKKSPELYRESFYKNSFYPTKVDEKIKITDGTEEQLKDLLTYIWDSEKIKRVVDSGVQIEVYLGNRDKITDWNSAYEFFKEFGEVCLIKGAGHTLQSRN
jgi:hypothetical protein